MATPRNVNDFIVANNFEQDMQDPDQPMVAGGSTHFAKDVTDGEFEIIAHAKPKRRALMLSLIATAVLGAAWVGTIHLAPSLLGIAGTPTNPEFPLAAAGGMPTPNTPAAALPNAAIPAQQPAAVAAPPAPAISAPPALVQNEFSTSESATGSAPLPTIAAQPAPAGPVAVQPPAAPAPVVSAPAITPPAAKSPATPTLATAAVVPAESAAPLKQGGREKAPQEVKPVAKVAPKPVAEKRPPGNPANRTKLAEDAGVRPLVTMSAEQIGIRSFGADSVTVAPNNGEAKTYRVGDTLPNGEKLKHLDSSSMTVVTDRRVIRLN